MGITSTGDGFERESKKASAWGRETGPKQEKVEETNGGGIEGGDTLINCAAILVAINDSLSLKNYENIEAVNPTLTTEVLDT